MILTLTTARGGTGVTTTAVALALGWPRPVILVEADPCGYSPIMAGYLRAGVTAGAGIVEASISARNGSLAADLPAMLVELPGSPARLLPGMTATAQRRAMTPSAWLDLAAALTEIAGTEDLDLLVDTGTLSAAGHPGALHALADVVVLLARSDLPSVYAARNWVDELGEMLAEPARLGLGVIGSDKPYSASEIAQYLGLPRLIDLPWDPVEAAAFTFGERLPRRPRGLLTRSVPAAVEAVRSAGSQVSADV